MRKQLRVTAVVALAATILFTTTSCDKEPVENRPDLAPAESMMMDFSDFATQPAGTKGSALSYDNFVFSYLTVGFWNASAVLVAAGKAKDFMQGIGLAKDSIDGGVAAEKLEALVRFTRENG